MIATFTMKSEIHNRPFFQIRLWPYDRGAATKYSCLKLLSYVHNFKFVNIDYYLPLLDPKILSNWIYSN